MQLFIGHPPLTDNMSDAERRTYSLLDHLGIEYETMVHTAVYTMCDHSRMEQELCAPICKNLLLCNRQQTLFFLLMIDAEKSFSAKQVAAQLGCSRLSLANAEQMKRLLSAQAGCVSPLCLQNDSQGLVTLVVDDDLTRSEYIGCHPCTNNATLKLRTNDLITKVMAAINHTVHIITT